MAQTPEAKVKKKVKVLLDKHGAYYFMPIGGPFATQGIPDIICCIKGKFIGIECKANGGRVTALQEKNLDNIEHNGGIAVLVDETGVDKLDNLLHSSGMWSSSGSFHNFSKRAGDE